MPHVTLRPPVTVRTFVTAVNPLYAQLSSAEVIDVLDELPNTPTADELTALTAFVDSEVTGGRWGTSINSYTDSLYDCFFCFPLTNVANSLTSWHPLVPKTAVNTAATKVSDGYSFNGTSSFIDTDFSPSTDGVNYQLDDALAGAFVKVNDAPGGNNKTLLGIAGFDADFYFYQITANFRIRINDIVNDAGGAETTFEDDSYYIMARTSSTQKDAFKDGVSILSTSRTSTSLPTANIVVGQLGTGAFFDGIISTAIIGGGIGFGQAAHNTNLVNLLTDLGVLP